MPCIHFDICIVLQKALEPGNIFLSKKNPVVFHFAFHLHRPNRDITLPQRDATKKYEFLLCVDIQLHNLRNNRTALPFYISGFVYSVQSAVPRD